MTTAPTTWRGWILESMGNSLSSAVILLLFSWRFRPDSWLGTVAFVIVVCIAAMPVAWLGHVWLHNAYAERLEARTAHEQPVSPARLAYLVMGLLCYLLFGGLFWFAAVRIGPSLPSF